VARRGASVARRESGTDIRFGAPHGARTNTAQRRTFVPKKVILHLTGEDPTVAEMEDEPKPGDLFIKVTNMRKRDGKEVSYLAPGVESVIFPWHRVNFLEMMPSEEDRDSVIDIFRT
jgi:hypothetical protein